MVKVNTVGCCLLVIAFVNGSLSAQNARQPNDRESTTPNQTSPSEATPSSEESASPQQSEVTIVLVGGGQIVADEVDETTDGFWYKRSNISTFLDRSKVKIIKRPAEVAPQSDDSLLQGDGRWHLADAARVEDFFAATFNRPLPLTAFGQSELHNRWRLDHRNGMDVGLHPDSPEGRALIKFLRRAAIPFMAFRNAIPGVATGPHIHIGNRSPRISIP